MSFAAAFLVGACAPAPNASSATKDPDAQRFTAWLVAMKTNVDIHMSAVGRYDDELVKRNGEWLIAKRRRIE